MLYLHCISKLLPALCYAPSNFSAVSDQLPLLSLTANSAGSTSYSSWLSTLTARLYTALAKQPPPSYLQLCTLSSSQRHCTMQCDLQLSSGAITAEIRHNTMDSVQLNGRGLAIEITTGSSLHFNSISFLVLAPQWYNASLPPDKISKMERCELCL